MKAARIVGERALTLSSGTTTSWNKTMKDGKFNNLPTHNPPPEEEPTPAPEIDKSPTKATQSSYQQLSKRVRNAKACVATIRRTKKRKMNGDGAGFLERVPSASLTVRDRLGVLDAPAVPTRDRLVMSTLLSHLVRRMSQTPIEMTVFSQESSLVLYSSFIALNNGL